ncbi:MAG TPA: aspartate--tRNA(Asn) ligase [Thermoplasmatales archaeon]|nr:aspartate--tRNA(Asn) ligase [Thermoplasmatales archaeon]
MYRTHYSMDLGPKDDGKEVSVAGWVEDVRNLGSIAFVILRDRKGTLQVTVFKKQGEVFETLTTVTRESVVSVKGVCKANEKVRNGYEIIPSEVEVLSTAKTPLPLGVVDKVESELDTRLDNRFLDLRKPDKRAIFVIRDVLLDAVREFLRGEGFIEVHTPKIIASSSEGGTDLFRVKYFEKDAFLAQSPQLYKQTLMATGLDRVFEVAWYFRAEEHNTRRHLNESTAIDLEMAFIKSEEEVMSVLEKLVFNIWKRVSELESELSLLNVSVEVPSLPFKRVTYDEVIDMLHERKVAIEWGKDLGSEEEKVLGEIMREGGSDFYFITKYPLESKPFYTMPEGEKLSKSFDLGCRGVEIASGSQRIHDPSLLEERLRECGLNPKDFENYLKAFRYGMPPHGGFGMGVERLLMEMLGIKNIRECILFPRDRSRLTP